MREIIIIDTTVFCRILRVPNMCSKQEHEAVLTEFNQLISRLGITTTFLLPLATIYETGNHIAQNGNGDVRRKAGLRFAKQVQMAFDNQAPWSPTPLPIQEEVAEWLPLFPDYAMSGVGFGDLSIIKVYDEQCVKQPLARVRIWSTDQHLATSYDRIPTNSLA